MADFICKGCDFHKEENIQKVVKTVPEEHREFLLHLLQLFFDVEDKEFQQFGDTIKDQFPHLSDWFVIPYFSLILI